MHIVELKTIDEIDSSFEVFSELRPHLLDRESFVDQILEQMKESYQVFAICNHAEVVSIIGFRVMTTLAWGRVLYIDDLVTREVNRGSGYAKALLNFAHLYANQKKCRSLHLDSGYARYDAHKLYLNFGFKLKCHHLSFDVLNNAST